jgi:hypothetical protein
MKKEILVLILALGAVGCSDWMNKFGSLVSGGTERNASTGSSDGQRYMTALEESVRAADRIVVTEHSNVWDAFDGKNPQSEVSYRPIVYATHPLSADERAAFLASVRAMDPKTQDAATACDFEPHHTIVFSRDGKTMSTLRVCFKCWQTEWDGSRATPPWALIPTLKKLVARVGMHEERDWAALAKTGRD